MALLGGKGLIELHTLCLLVAFMHVSHTNFSVPLLCDMCQPFATLIVHSGTQANLDDKLHVVVDHL